ncbi:MAG: hypothetical protein PHX38_10345 [Sulfuricella sp.]|nr:hypothetical protein [Sulfuricella sp.]
MMGQVVDGSSLSASDIKLLQLKNGQATELQGDASDLENPLQALIEVNLESLARPTYRLIPWPNLFLN